MFQPPAPHCFCLGSGGGWLAWGSPGTERLSEELTGSMLDTGLVGISG